MDYMDIDEVLDVPDTPDRLASQHKNDRVFAVNRSINKQRPSTICLPENIDASDDTARCGVRNKIIFGKQSKRLTFRPPKSSSPLETSESHSNSGICDLDNSSASKSSHLFRTMGVDKRASHEGRHFVPFKQMEKGKALSSNQSSSCVKNNAVVDLTEPNGHAQELREDSRYEALKYPHQDTRKGVLSTNGFSLSGVKNPLATNSLCKGKEKMDDTCKGVTDSKRETNIELVDSQLNILKSVSTSLHTSNSCRFPSQKRLVRNGCISPHNIAKAKQLAENHDTDSADVAQNDARTVESVSETNIKDLIDEDKDSRLVKGKMVIKYPLSLKETDSKSRHLFSRGSRNHDEKVNPATDASKYVLPGFNGLDGWRSTRNRSYRMPEKSLNHSRRKNDLLFFNQQEQGIVRRDTRNGEPTGGNYPREQEPVSHESSSPETKETSHFCQVNELHNAADTLGKRQKYCLTLGDCGQCSTSAIDNSDIVFVGSSGGPPNATSTENQINAGLSNLDSVIEIDEFSPQIGYGRSHIVNSSTNDESDARARQVETDEMLARELQEQLYSESPEFGGDEFDEHIAQALQQEEESLESFSAGGRSVFHPRGPFVSNVRSQNVSIRRGSNARLAHRMEQLRSHFHGQSPGASSRERIGVSSRERSSLFHLNVDVDMRLQVLEALEAFSDMGMANEILQVQRDFNENDYEMLLALDENNHHVGASVHQINGLPESTVQTENLEESCAICLGTPTIGDKIRHLPCLHKFHKDCIDPWLRRKTSCPVCSHPSHDI